MVTPKQFGQGLVFAAAAAGLAACGGPVPVIPSAVTAITQHATTVPADAIRLAQRIDKDAKAKDVRRLIEDGQAATPRYPVIANIAFEDAKKDVPTPIPVEEVAIASILIFSFNGFIAGQLYLFLRRGD